MWWFIGIGVLLILGLIAYRAEKREQRKFLAQLERYTAQFQQDMSLDRLPALDPRELNYNPSRGEIVHGAWSDIRKGDQTGRLLITNKAIIFEGLQRNERIARTSISSVELRRDGLLIKRRTGKHIAYLTGQRADLLALAQTIFSPVSS